MYVTTGNTSYPGTHKTSSQVCASIDSLIHYLKKNSTVQVRVRSIPGMYWYLLSSTGVIILSYYSPYTTRTDYTFE